MLDVPDVNRDFVISSSIFHPDLGLSVLPLPLQVMPTLPSHDIFYDMTSGVHNTVVVFAGEHSTRVFDDRRTSGNVAQRRTGRSALHALQLLARGCRGARIHLKYSSLNRTALQLVYVPEGGCHAPFLRRLPLCGRRRLRHRQFVQSTHTHWRHPDYGSCKTHPCLLLPLEKHTRYVQYTVCLFSDRSRRLQPLPLSGLAGHRTGNDRDYHFCSHCAQTGHRDARG